MDVYKLQNSAIHEARRQLESSGALDPWQSLEQIRGMAAEINQGVASISKLSLEQRRDLIDQLIEKGARVKNPSFYESDLKAESARSGRKRKVLKLTRVNERQRRLIDTLAAQIVWPHSDSLQSLCLKLFNASEPRNSKEVKHVVAVLNEIIERDKKRAAADNES